MIKTRPILKWAGNKFGCLNHILPQFIPAKRLIEPFTGSAAIFMNADFPKYLLAEANQDLIFLFQHLQKEGESFIAYCEGYFSKESNTSRYYYELRNKFNQTVEPRERAALFLYLNRHGYNGLCRYNQRGGYNVPFGLYIKPYFPHKEMQFFHKKSAKATFIHSDFCKTFELAKKGDLIYCDPPYAPLKQVSNFSSYIDKKFNLEDQIKLAALAKDAASRGITVIISNHDTAFTREHYDGAEIKSFQVRRLINCVAENRSPVRELVAIFHAFS